MAPEALITGKYRPWPIATLAVVLGMGSLFYFYDLALLVRTGSVHLPVACGFVAGIVVCAGLAGGLWKLQSWARVVLIWLGVLLIGSMLFALPIAFFLRPAGMALNISAFVPLLVLVGMSVLLVRYLGREATRRIFAPDYLVAPK